ncbi:unnamed protein product [Urochloa humidicola]
MALYNTWATFSHSTRDPAASSVLESGWVQIFNIPDHARNVDAVTLIAELAGDVIAVDEVSLIKEDPVRVKLQAREIAKLRGYIEFFAGGVGYEVQFIPEMPEKRTQPPAPPAPSQKPDGGHYDGDDEDDLLDSDEEKGKRNSRERGPRRDKTPKHSDDPGKGGQASSTSRQRGGPDKQLITIEGEEITVEDPRPISVFDPTTGKAVDTDAFERQTQREGERETNGSHGRGRIPTPAPDQFVVQCGDGEYELISKEKWPVLKLPEKPQGTATELDFPTSQDSLGPGELVQEKGQESEAGKETYEDDEGARTEGYEENPAGWESLQHHATQSRKRRFFPAIAARKSSRGRGTNTTKIGGAMILAQDPEMAGSTWY